MPAAMITAPDREDSSGVTQYMQAFTQAPLELATAMGDGVKTGLHTVRNYIGPSDQAIQDVADMGYRTRETDWFGNDWHRIFDPDDDGSVDLTNVALAFGIMVMMTQMGIPIVRMLGGAAKGIGTSMFRYNTARRQNKTHELLAKSDRSTRAAQVTMSDMVNRLTEDNGELTTKLMNAIKFNNKSYLN